MPVTKEQKKVMLEELVEKFKKAKSVAFAQNSGLTVAEVKELRSKLREKNADMKVAKKTLMKIAAKEAGYDIPDEYIPGAVGAVFSYEDVVSGAKTIYDYAKKHEALALLGALLDGKVLSLEDSKSLANLPSKEELLAKLVYLLKSPVTGFHGVLKNTLAGFVRVLDGISKK